MLANFILSFSSNDTVNIYNNVINSCGIPPTIIKVSDIDTEYNIPEIDRESISASMFLPPVEIFKLLIDPTDENMYIFENEYINYLSSDIQSETIALIIVNAMQKFIDSNGMSCVIFEMNLDQFNTSRLDIFLNYLFFKFGISFNGSHNLNFETLSNIYNLLYAFNLINGTEFLSKVPKLPNGNCNVYDFNISKIKEEMEN